MDECVLRQIHWHVFLVKESQPSRRFDKDIVLPHYRIVEYQLGTVVARHIIGACTFMLFFSHLNPPSVIPVLLYKNAVGVRLAGIILEYDRIGHPDGEDRKSTRLNSSH